MAECKASRELTFEDQLVSKAYSSLGIHAMAFFYIYHSRLISVY